MEIKEKNLDALIMTLSNRKEITIESAKINKNIIVEYTIKNIKEELKKYRLNGEYYCYTIGYNKGYDLNKLYVVVSPLNPTICNRNTLTAEIELGKSYEELSAEKISYELARSFIEKIDRLFDNECSIKKEFIESYFFNKLIQNLPFGNSNFYLSIGEKSTVFYEPEFDKFGFVFNEADVPKENIVSLINSIVFNIGTLPNCFSEISFKGKNYNINVKYKQQSYTVIKAEGLSSKEEVEYLKLAGDASDRVRFSGKHLQYDITQSELCENLVDIHFEEKGKVFDIIRNKVEGIEEKENSVIKFFQKEKPDYLGKILKEHGVEI